MPNRDYLSRREQLEALLPSALPRQHPAQARNVHRIAPRYYVHGPDAVELVEADPQHEFVSAPTPRPAKKRTWLEFIEDHQVLVTVVGTVAATALTGLGAYAVSSWRRKSRERRIRALHEEHAAALKDARLLGAGEVERVQGLYQRLLESELSG